MSSHLRKELDLAHEIASPSLVLGRALFGEERNA